MAVSLEIKQSAPHITTIRGKRADFPAVELETIRLFVQKSETVEKTIGYTGSARLHRTADHTLLVELDPHDDLPDQSWKVLRELRSKISAQIVSDLQDLLEHDAAFSRIGPVRDFLGLFQDEARLLADLTAEKERVTYQQLMPGEEVEALRLMIEFRPEIAHNCAVRFRLRHNSEHLPWTGGKTETGEPMARLGETKICTGRLAEELRDGEGFAPVFLVTICCVAWQNCRSRRERESLLADLLARAGYDIEKEKPFIVTVPVSFFPQIAARYADVVAATLLRPIRSVCRGLLEHGVQTDFLAELPTPRFGPEVVPDAPPGTYVLQPTDPSTAGPTNAQRAKTAEFAEGKTAFANGEGGLENPYPLGSERWTCWALGNAAAEYASEAHPSGPVKEFGPDGQMDVIMKTFTMNQGVQAQE